MAREYDKTHYKKLRAKILAMDNACYYCGQEATTIDHMVPISKGGISSEDNLSLSSLTRHPNLLYGNSMLIAR